MPIYEYQCTSCQQCLTVQASMHDPQPTKVPGCSGESCSIRKLLSPVFGQVAGVHRAPAPVSSVAPKKESPSHVCAKYCDHHK